MSEQNMTSEIVSLRNENAVLREELALANQQLEWFRKQIFGRKTEQTSVVMEKEFGVQLSMFGNNEEKSAAKSAETITVPEHKRKKKRTHDEWMNSLPVKEEHHEIKDPVCEICGAEMVEIGDEKAYDELVFTPPKYHIRRHIVHKYKCPECGEKPEERDENCHIVRATYPHAMIPGSYCSPELLAHIIYEKYAKSVPLHRQEKDFNSKKIPLLKATMSNWVGQAAEKCLVRGRSFTLMRPQFRCFTRTAENLPRHQECGSTATAK